MYKVKYREYWNDTHYNFLEKEFSCLEEISDWLFSQMQTRVSSENMTFEYHLLPDNTGYCSINIHPDPSSEKDVTIFLIIDEKGVIYYSNGRMTDRKYVSKKVSAWMEECRNQIKHPCYKYADEEPDTCDLSQILEEHPEESFVELHFSGYGDDTFGEYNLTGEDYDNCGSRKPIRCIIDCGEKGKLMVTGQYLKGCWAVGISKVGIDGRMPEEDPMPNWDIRIVECPDCPYTTMAVIRIPDVKEEEVHLHWFNDEKPVNG